MADPISLSKLQTMVADPGSDVRELARYLHTENTPDTYGPELRIRPDTVEYSFDEPEKMWRVFEGLDSLVRSRRRALFVIKNKKHRNRSVIVCEGDSWLQYPLFLDDIGDHLAKKYLVWMSRTRNHNGDNGVIDINACLKGLNEQASAVQALVVSGGGSTLFGLSSHVEPTIAELVHRASQSRRSPEQLVRETQLERALETIEAVFRELIGRVRNDVRFRELPILIHGYDYPIPRKPGSTSAEKMEAGPNSLHAVLVSKGVTDSRLQRDVLRLVVDRLNEVLGRLADDTGVVLVDLRGTLPNARDWSDEFHPTSKGFGKLAKRFVDTLDGLLKPRSENARADTKRREKRANPRVNLVVTAPHPLAEIEVADSELQTVAKGISKLCAKLPKGIYQLTVRLGRQYTRELFRLDDEKHLKVDPISYSANIPIPGTRQARESHTSFMQDAVKMKLLKYGTGSELMVLARAWTEHGNGRFKREELPLILRWRGDRLASLGRNGKRHKQGDEVTACRLGLNPGTYLLSFQTPGGIVHQAVHTLRGWCTEVYLLRKGGRPRARHGRREDSEFVVYDVTVAMRPLGKEESPTFDDYHMMELARLRLADEEGITSDQLNQLSEFVRSSEVQPELLMMAAHLMLIARENAAQKLAVIGPGKKGAADLEPDASVFDQSRFDAIVKQLAKTFGADNPDVVALTSETSDDVDIGVKLTEPPAFWRSWVLLVRASNRKPDLISTFLSQRLQFLETRRPYLSWQEATPDLTRQRRAAMDVVAQVIGEGIDDDTTVIDAATDSPSQVLLNLDFFDNSANAEASEAFDDLDRYLHDTSQTFNMPRGQLDKALRSRRKLK